MIQQIKTLLSQPSKMFYTLMIWVSLSLCAYFIEPKDSSIWQIEYPMLYAFFCSLLITLGCTAINANSINKPKPEITIYTQILSYIFFMAMAFAFYQAKDTFTNIPMVLRLASALWMVFEQGKKEKETCNENTTPTSNNRVHSQ